MKNFKFLCSIVLVCSFFYEKICASPSKKIVLITNLGRSEDALALKLENEFFASIDRRDNEFETFRNIDPYDLYKVVSSNNIEGIFLFAHMNKLASRQLNLFSKKGLFISYNGRNDRVDIKPFFYQLNLGIKFVALCGCHSETHVEILKKYSECEQPLIQTFTGYVDAYSGLKEAIEFYNNVDKSEWVGACEIRNQKATEEKDAYVSVTRTMPELTDDSYFPAIKIIHKNKIVAMFPAGYPGQSQKIKFALPIPPYLHSQESYYKFRVDSGILGRTAKQNLGNFMFESSQIKGKWTRFSNEFGEPFGGSAHIYQFSFKSS
ncbi:MAG: hypothetical protein AB8G05_02480 [Oligoflexales bacterium]